MKVVRSPLASLACFTSLGLLAAGSASCSSSAAAAQPNDATSNEVATTDTALSDTASDDAAETLVDNSPPAWNVAVTPPSDDTAKAQRAACAYQPGDLPQATQGASAPDGSKIPIDTVVIMMMENRSFDHYFQSLPTSGQPDVEVAPSTFTNPSADGTTTVGISRDTQLCIVDPNHSWAGVHQQYDDGKMDGFVTSNDGTSELPAHGTPDLGSGNRVMVYYEQQDLPLAYWAANTYAVADHYHSSLLGPTWPNRMFLYAATSLGETDNSFPNTPATILVDELETRGVSWGIYTDGTAGMAIFTKQFLQYAPTNLFPISQFATDAAAGTLPHVVFLDPNLSNEVYDGDDEHPPGIMEVGEQWISQQLTALVASPQWPRAALFWTYDEHGGFYDHVVPPAACTPDDLPVLTSPGDPVGAKFDTYGIRVPMMVLSPWAKKHYVAHDTYDHTSITRFVESRFVLPALTRRDANAEIPWEMFDFTQTPDTSVPSLPTVTVDAAKVSSCAAIYGN